MSASKVPVSTNHPEEMNSAQKTGELQNVRASNRLNGKNYLKWSQFIRAYLKGKGRLSHLLGTAREIWDYTRRTYSKANDAAQVYEIKVKTAATKQGDKSVTEYASLLQNLWQELDHYRVFEMKSPEDAAILKKFIEKDRVYDFLAGLNPEFDQVRIQILGKEETPPLEETISLVRAEESRRGVMLQPQTLDGSALVAKANHREKGRSDAPVQYQSREGQWKENKDNLWCTYCKKPRHTRDKCWKLNGKPPSHEWGTRGGQSRPQTYMTDPPRPQAHMVEQPKK
ncbi:hypothetical protein HPP92_024459 [Vanilla planifolia]|uniref:Retrotransposon gag domain-containing protein n=1 Tax=Vanilla planifolia TaxID=51239 RepID=A0A835UB63_VANPL|nr:hypothetical protein HPP92_024459 [Vanilla planifolia]